MVTHIKQMYVENQETEQEPEKTRAALGEDNGLAYIILYLFVLVGMVKEIEAAGEHDN
jgi:hypothetical protein